MSVDPGKNNIAILVVEVNEDERQIIILYNTVVSIQTKDIEQLHLLLIREVQFLYDIYSIELTTIESQQKEQTGQFIYTICTTLTYKQLYTRLRKCVIVMCLLLIQSNGTSCLVEKRRELRCINC